jgi:hypothetical protein
MMRLTRAQLASLRFLATGLIAALVFALWVWATQPPRIYSQWIGFDGLPSNSPSSRVVAWARWSRGPRTPSGFLALFDVSELIFSGALLMALVLLVLFLLAPAEIDGPMWRRLSAKLGALRFRMRTALILVAILGVYLCWEIQAWRAWRLRSNYWEAAAGLSQGLSSNLRTLQKLREEEPYSPGMRGSTEMERRVLKRSKAAAAKGIAVKELKKQEVDIDLAKLVAQTEGKRNCERAADHPLGPAPPGRPSPQTDKEAAEWRSPSMTTWRSRIRTWSRPTPGRRGSGPPVPTPSTSTESARSSQPGVRAS